MFFLLQFAILSTVLLAVFVQVPLLVKDHTVLRFGLKDVASDLPGAIEIMRLGASGGECETHRAPKHP